MLKRFFILLLAVLLLLSGCKKKKPAGIPGAESVPEGIEWQMWELYTPASLVMAEETVDVLIGLDAIHAAIYYDKAEQELMTSITILEPLSDVDYSREHLRILDQNQDGYDDLCIPDMLPAGDRTMNWWLWDPKEKTFRYAEEYFQIQEEIGGDISWMDGMDFIYGTMETPDGPQDLLILVEDGSVKVWLDEREEQLWGTAQIPAPLSAAALDHLDIYTYWECWDLNGDGWGDLQLPYRWEETQDGSVYQYCYCWLWDSDSGSYVYDAKRSLEPAI